MTRAPSRAANADHLTKVLRKSGVLGDGSVRGVDLENPRDTILSHIVRVKLTYDGVASGAPLSLFLKTARRDRLNPSWVAGRQEVAFYTQVASHIPAGLVPRCFDADWNAETNEWHLLLEDLTVTHEPATIWPLPPTLEQCEIIVGSLARVHAQWWDKPGLGAANFSTGCSMPRPGSGNGISRIAMSRSFTATRMSGIACCRAIPRVTMRDF